MVDPLSSARWELVPSHLQPPLRDYLLTGTVPVNHRFLMAVLSNDLAGAIETADAEKLLPLFQIVWFLRDYAAPAWGSPERVALWEELGGFAGRDHDNGAAA